MAKLPIEEGMHSPSKSPRSPGSWADTDVDTDSDMDDYGQFVDCCDPSSFGHDNVKKQGPFNRGLAPTRTAPIMIPSRSSIHRARESQMNTFEWNQAENQDETIGEVEEERIAFEEDDEDDPALYSNIAYFKSQYGHNIYRPPLRRPSLYLHQAHQQACARHSSQRVPNPANDEEIFNLEL